MTQYTHRLIVAALALACAAVTAVPVASQGIPGRRVSCEAGLAEGYACDGIDLLARLDAEALGEAAETRLSDLWGWTDTGTGRRYALVGHANGTAFVDVTEPTDPVYLGVLPRTGTRSSIWRDIKVYGPYAYVVADGAGPHGLQVFDLRELRDVTTPRVFAESGHFDGFGSAHNLFVNEETGFAYVGGASQGIDPSGDACNRGLVMLDLADPARPSFAGCFNHPGTGRAGTGYVHDVQCVVYRGPDADWTDREICFGSNETAVSIADVTDKTRPQPIALGTYPTVQYTHQGWLSEDHRWFFVGDELDEISAGLATRTLVFDVSDLDDPVLAAEFTTGGVGPDHNMYVRDHWLFQANYTQGLVVLDVTHPLQPTEYGRFDTTPGETGRFFEGAWSVYPFLDDGTVLVSSINQGLFVLAASDGSFAPRSHAGTLPDGIDIMPAWPNPFSERTQVSVRMRRDGPVRAELVDALGRVRRILLEAEGRADATVTVPVEAGDLEAGTYWIRITGPETEHSVPVTRIR